MANTITFFRIAAGIVLLFCPVFSPAFYVFYTAALVLQSRNEEEKHTMKFKGSLIVVKDCKRALKCRRACVCLP